MAINTRQKRMSALHTACPWRGALVHAPDAGTDAGDRLAAGYLYSGLEPVTSIGTLGYRRFAAGRQNSTVLRRFSGWFRR